MLHQLRLHKRSTIVLVTAALCALDGSEWSRC